MWKGIHVYCQKWIDGRGCCGESLQTYRKDMYVYLIQSKLDPIRLILICLKYSIIFNRFGVIKKYWKPTHKHNALRQKCHGWTWSFFFLLTVFPYVFISIWICWSQLRNSCKRKTEIYHFVSGFLNTNWVSALNTCCCTTFIGPRQYKLEIVKLWNCRWIGTRCRNNTLALALRVLWICLTTTTL